MIPHLRAFARSLCGDAVHADDLAQDAMLKAWESRASYEVGTNMKAWCFTILRNLYYSERRRSWRSQPLEPAMAEETLVAADNPEAGMELLDLRNALMKLPVDQREALILVGAGGMSYEDAAGICDCAVGTMKSRVNRARKALTDLMTRDVVAPSNRDRLRASQAFDDLMGQVELLAGAGV